MKVISFLVALLGAAVVHAQQLSGASPTMVAPSFSVADFLPEGDLFKIKGLEKDVFVFNWDGAILTVSRDGVILDTVWDIDRLTGLMTFQARAYEGDEGLVGDFDYIEGDLDVQGSALNVTVLGFDLFYLDGELGSLVIAETWSRYDKNGRASNRSVVLGTICDCSDRITLTCKRRDCDVRTDCGQTPNICKTYPALEPDDQEPI